MRTHHLHALVAASIKFADIPAHDLEVADERDLCALPINEHAGKRVLVKRSGLVYRYDPDYETGRRVFVESPFTEPKEARCTPAR